MEHSITKTINSGCITQYMYTVGELTLFGFKIMEIPLKEHDLPIWFLNFMNKKGVFVTHDGDSILISGMENNYNRVLERSSTSLQIHTYNRLRVGDYIVYDPRFDDVYATNSDGFIKLLETISGYTLELDTCSEDASAIDDMDNDMDNDMKKYSETETNSNESLVEYVYHIDDITLLGFKILKLPLKISDYPTWFSNFINKADVCLRYLNYSREYICISNIANDYKRENSIYNHLTVGDYILYDSRFDKVYATDYDGILNIFNTITGYPFESDSNVIETKKDNINPSHYKFGEMANNMKISDLSSDLNGDPGIITAGVIETKKDNINPNHYKFGDMEAMPFIDAVTEFGEFQPVETPHVKDAIKYLIRYPRKNGLEDLKKAQWFINHLIEIREKIEGSVGNRSVYTEAMTSDNSTVTFTNDSEVNYSGHGLAYVQALVKHGIIYTDISWTRKKIKTLSGDLFINAGDSLRYFDDVIYFYNQDGVHRLSMEGEQDACR